MPRKAKPDDPEQSKRFRELARQFAEVDRDSFERDFRKVAGAPKTSREPKTKRPK